MSHKKHLWILNNLVWFDLRFVNELVSLLIFVACVKIIGDYTDQMSGAHLHHDGNLRKTPSTEVMFS